METELTEKRRTLIFAVIVVTCILCSMLSTALTTALPQIMTEFGITAGTGQWLTSVYSLVMGILVLATAFLIKRFKTKQLYLASLAVFTLGLILDAFTGSFAVMMVGRLLQAAGNGVLLSLGQVVLLTIYPRSKRGSIMGIYGLAVGAAPVVAPTIAGIIVDTFGWRMIFYGLLIISTIALFLTAVAFENVLENEKQEFDLRSFVLCSAGFSGVLYGMGNLGAHPFAGPYVLLPLAGGIICCGLFVHRQLHMDKPFLELRILKVKKFAVAVIASMVLYACLMALAVLLPLYIQNLCGYSATVSGLVTMPGSLAMAFISPVAGRLYDKMGMRRIFGAGAALMTVSCLGMAFMGTGTNMIVVAAWNVVRNISTGLLMMPLVTWGMSGLSEKDTGHGTSLLTSLRTVAGSFGAAVFMAFVSAVSVQSSESAGMRAAFAGLVVLGVVELLLAAYAAIKIRD